VLFISAPLWIDAPHLFVVSKEGTIVERSVIFSSGFKGRCAFAPRRHTLARRIVALADKSSLFRGFTR